MIGFSGAVDRCLSILLGLLELLTYINVLHHNALRDPFQSAYHAGHSTETALIRVKNDIASALDRKCSTILVLLDLSCAFDTINHEILLRRLEHSVGISGAALEWLHSYVSERYHQVAVSSVVQQIREKL